VPESVCYTIGVLRLAPEKTAELCCSEYRQKDSDRVAPDYVNEERLAITTLDTALKP
jgi:hypothetical protein